MQKQLCSSYDHIKSKQAKPLLKPYGTCDLQSGPCQPNRPRPSSCGKSTRTATAPSHRSRKRELFVDYWRCIYPLCAHVYMYIHISTCICTVYLPIICTYICIHICAYVDYVYVHGRPNREYVTRSGDHSRNIPRYIGYVSHGAVCDNPPPRLAPQHSSKKPRVPDQTSFSTQGVVEPARRYIPPTMFCTRIATASQRDHRWNDRIKFHVI